MKLILHQQQCPGDVLVMSAALECLHQQYPGWYLTDVKSDHNCIYDHNPWVTRLSPDDPAVHHLILDYPLINQADHRNCHFMMAFVESLARQLCIKLELTVKRPYLYLSDSERAADAIPEMLLGKRFWLLNAGWKTDYTVKKWQADRWAAVVAWMREQGLTVVQVGSLTDRHPRIPGAVDLIGRTTLRQLIVLASHSAGILTAESFLHHVGAALVMPCVTLLSGFLPRPWVQYHTGTLLGHGEAFPCCAEGKGCWRSRVVPEGDGDGKDGSLCALPVLTADPVASCLAAVSVDEVIRAIDLYLKNAR